MVQQATHKVEQEILHFLSPNQKFFGWNFKKQDTVAQSTAEYECIAAATAINQAIWIRKVADAMIKSLSKGNFESLRKCSVFPVKMPRKSVERYDIFAVTLAWGPCPVMKETCLLHAFVAIKLLKAQGGLDANSVVSKEVEALSRLSLYVVPLLGHCLEFQGKHSETLLVFEYMPNVGAVRGLEYLHDAAAPRILHRDVKSTNILLDENWRAKITDLGMAKRLKADGFPSSSSSPTMQGTFVVYFTPEYEMVGGAGRLSCQTFSVLGSSP
ncbi:receptor-like serine/threonine-protein kinase NCRK [Hevea brasiliensis]|uniref:receptor-like serine/threonine-protein kinase NCRK n=1 Tax=Hevea brasiliensis TaxID=3981 RepID=UPI0025F4F76A|nr:receptor-like serine/threonine-protein kinase NCRK [Hevea brasiliensis]